MANPEKGEVSVNLDGTVYTLALSLNAMIAVEDLFDMSFEEVSASVAKPRGMKYLRGLVWAVLQRHHSEITIEEVGDLIRSSNMGKLNDALGRASAAAQPDPEDVKAVNPRKAQAKARVNGTGAASTSTRGASV